MSYTTGFVEVCEACNRSFRRIGNWERHQRISPQCFEAHNSVRSPTDADADKDADSATSNLDAEYAEYAELDVDAAHFTTHHETSANANEDNAEHASLFVADSDEDNAAPAAYYGADGTDNSDCKNEDNESIDSDEENENETEEDNQSDVPPSINPYNYIQEKV